MILRFYNSTRQFTTLLFVILILLNFSSLTFGQTISGKVISNLKNEPLMYVNIGVIGTSIGTISNKNGEFEFNVQNIYKDSLVRFSMIGFESKTFTIAELLNKKNQIILDNKPIQLAEITIKPSGKFEKVGTTNCSKLGGVCGWGGTNFGKGHELGLLLDFGTNAVKIENFNIKVHNQSFDTIVSRLHIRSLKNGIPSDELLTQNVYIDIKEAGGWQKIDLSNYNIFVKGSAVLSIEWISISNVINKKSIKVNGKKDTIPKILFNMNNKYGTFYFRKGSEAKWRKSEGNSPGFYVTVKE